jgi:hypothetical protein
MRSVVYWIIVLSMIVGSRIAAMFWFGSEPIAAKGYLLFGAAPSPVYR